MRGAVWQQTGLYFGAPLVFALVHCIFGLALIGFLAFVLGSSSFVLICTATISGTIVLLALYYVITSRVCEKMLLPQVDRSDLQKELVPAE